MANPGPLQKAQYQLRIPEDIKEQAKQKAKERRWSLNTFFCYAIEEQIKREQGEAV